jgi:nucleotidyltransferase/DNA polymerase involved in DNA repair
MAQINPLTLPVPEGKPSRPVIACVLIPHFPLRVTLLDQPQLDGLPLVLGPRPGGRPLVADTSPEATERGIRIGMTLREAMAMVPEVVVVDPHPARESDVAEAILASLAELSPLVEPDRPGRCYIDLTGSARHLGTPARAAERIIAALSPALRPRVGIAPGKFAAWVASRKAPPGQSRIVPPDGVAAFLAPEPSTSLPISPDMGDLLIRLGLKSLGQLADLAPGAVAARLGPDGRRAWLLASGQSDLADTTVLPREPVLTVTERVELPAPSTGREMLFLGIDEGIARAFGRPDMRDRHVRQVTLSAGIEDGRSWDRLMTLREPTGSERLGEVLRQRLGDLALPGAAERITLSLTGIITAPARQEALPGVRRRRPRPLVEAVQQLKQRYGASPIYRIAEVEPWSRIPERRHALISYEP